MAAINKKFVDDGWAVWIEGDDVSTVYINDWINPKGKSYIDFAIRIRGVKLSKSLNVFIPFEIEKNDIQDISQQLAKENIFRLIFNNAGLYEHNKNEYTSEAAYNGKTIDIIHCPIEEYEISKISYGTLLKLDLLKMQSYIDNDEAYFFIRFPHKSMDQIFKPQRSMSTILTRFRDLVMSPVVSDSYVYQVRINEARMLPEKINKISSFHRQRLKKALVSIAIKNDYEVNDNNCYKISRIEESIYKDFVPSDYKLQNVTNYLWQEDRDDDYQGRFNFYMHFSKSEIGRASMFIYLILILLLGVMGDALWDIIVAIFNIQL